MATIPVDVQQRINEMYNKQRETQLGKLRSEQQKQTNAINTQKTQTGQQYYDKRNQADVANFQSRKALQEMMAASGLARSGENISGQVALQASRQNTLGGLNRDEQGAIHALNTRLNEVNDPSKQNNIVSAIESQRSAALAEALERAIERQRQQEQFQAQLEAERLAREEQKRQFEARLAWEKEQYNRSLAAKASKSGGSSSRRSTSSGSTSKAPAGQDKSLGQLLEEFRGSDQSGLPILQKRSVVSSRVPLQTAAEGASSGGFGGGRRWLSEY